MARVRGTPRPYAETRPTITGTPTVGQNLVCNDGVWIPQSVTVTRQWIRDANTVIVGATGPAYALVGADQTHTVKCRVTATNIYDTTTIDTPSSAVVT